MLPNLCRSYAAFLKVVVDGNKYVIVYIHGFRVAQEAVLSA